MEATSLGFGVFGFLGLGSVDLGIGSSKFKGCRVLAFRAQGV